MKNSIKFVLFVTAFAFSIDCNSLTSWGVGNSYNAGDIVTHSNKAYQCKDWPQSGWCPLEAYEPNKAYGEQAWTHVGECDSENPSELIIDKLKVTEKLKVGQNSVYIADLSTSNPNSPSNSIYSSIDDLYLQPIGALDWLGNPITTPWNTILNTNGGKVGIGTSDPKTTLQLGDDWTFLQASYGTNVLGRNIYWDPTAGIGKKIINGPSSSVRWQKSGSLLLQVAPTGVAESKVKWKSGLFLENRETKAPRVGINTTSPWGALDVLHRAEGDYERGVVSRVDRDLTKAFSVVKDGADETFTVWGNGVVNANTIWAKAIKVRSNTTGKSWPDYVFKKGYKLQSLSQVEKFIKANSHLPEVPSSTEVAKNGVDLLEMNKVLLKKVEELTLHLINLKKDNNHMNSRIQSLEKASK
jgi:hypothetical protein